MSGLTLFQKRELCALARRVYVRWPGREEFENANPEMSATACFEAWRHFEQGKACGRQSLCDCTQDDFLKIRAHFHSLLGNGGQAARDLLRSEEEPRIRARYILQQELDARKLDESYAATICRSKYKCPLGEATDRQLWGLVFDIRKRRKAQFSARIGRHVKVKAGVLSVTAGSSGDPF